MLLIGIVLGLFAKWLDNITQIALRVGFSGSSAFSRAFKKVTGTTPSEYRAKTQSEKLEGLNDAALEEAEIRAELYQSGGTSDDGKVHRLVTADLSNSSPVLLRKIWSSAINIGEVHDLTKANIQRHCLYLRDHLHYRYVRIWNVFSTKLMLTDGSAPGRYNFSMLDQVLDFILENRLKPFLDFGRRPSMAMNADGKIVYAVISFLSMRDTILSDRRINRICPSSGSRGILQRSCLSGFRESGNRGITASRGGSSPVRAEVSWMSGRTFSFPRI